jgi:superfamily I DNA/RNA helicase
MVVRFNTDDVTIHLASAGAGKTTTAMQVITDALKSYRPDEIAFVTYTRKGVETGVARALAVNKDLTPDDLMHFKTLHALCFREAHLARKNIITQSDIAQFNSELGFSLTMNDAFGHVTEDDRLLQRYDAERSGSKRGVFVDGNYDRFRYDRLVNAYKAFKEGHDLVDFYDCLLKYMEQGEPLQGVKIALIDECQDLTPLQWQVCMKAFSEAEKVICLGDDFQCLYTYNGAAPELLVEMASHYKTVKHEISYRLPRKVYEFSKGITDLIQEKVEKDYRPADDREGFVETLPDRNVLARLIRDDLKSNGVMPGRWYLLFRTNCFIADMATVLEQFIVPYHTSKGFCIPARDLNKIERYYNYRKVGYGNEEAKQRFMEENKITDINDSFMHSELIPGKERYFYQDLVDTWGLETLKKMSTMTEPFCLLSTVHKVKGGEADYTAMFMDCTRVVSENITLNADEELRVLYVGCTRSREGLYLIPASGKYSLSKLIDIVKELNDVQ